MTRPERSVTAAQLLDVVEVERLAIQPGDIVVVKAPMRLTAGDCEYIHDKMKAVLPDTDIIVLECGMDIAVIKASE